MESGRDQTAFGAPLELRDEGDPSVAAESHEPSSVTQIGPMGVAQCLVLSKR